MLDICGEFFSCIVVFRIVVIFELLLLMLGFFGMLFKCVFVIIMLVDDFVFVCVMMLWVLKFWVFVVSLMVVGLDCLCSWNLIDLVIFIIGILMLVLVFRVLFIVCLLMLLVMISVIVLCCVVVFFFWVKG